MNKHIIIAFFLNMISFFIIAQIPNNGFELWTTINGYQNPTGWGNLNEITKSYSVFTCAKLSPGNPGNNYLSIRTLSITGKGLIPGRIVSGKIDTSTYKAVSGFPFNSRPENLSYSMQYMVTLPTDTAFVSVLLSKWNSILLRRDTIAYGINRYNAMAHQWYTSTTYLNYKSGDSPDSVCIVISSSGTAALENSYMYIDNLNFNGNVIGLKENITYTKNISVFPNPSNGLLNIDLSELNSTKKIEVSLFNSLSVLVYSFKEITNNVLKINALDIPLGIYLLKVKCANDVINVKVIIE